MHTILIALNDRILADQVRAGVRNFKGFRGLVIAPAELEKALEADPEAAAVLFDHPGRNEELEELVLRLQAEGHPRRLLVVGDRNKRKEAHRAKVELGLFSFIPLPLDPFDLARRLHRLRADLAVERRHA